uniref:uncharacterized protein n=1 Tax=Centroberyx gerrardi TaxID=166262 RepID=UPI003AAB2050
MLKLVLLCLALSARGLDKTRALPSGFRQGTEPSTHRLPNGFQQGTEPSAVHRFIPDGFRQGTEPSRRFLVDLNTGLVKEHISEMDRRADGFRQGTEPMISIPDGFRQGTKLSTSRLQTETVVCEGEIINGNCYQFNPTPLAFQDAQSTCRALAPNADLASVTNGDLHSRLVSMVTKGGTTSPVLTWLGGVVKKQQAAWVDGSEWGYSDWMPGHPNIHTDKPVCLEMFKIDESWWTAADCELQRASICSYPLAA